MNERGGRQEPPSKWRRTPGGDRTTRPIDAAGSPTSRYKSRPKGTYHDRVHGSSIPPGDSKDAVPWYERSPRLTPEQLRKYLAPSTQDTGNSKIAGGNQEVDPFEQTRRLISGETHKEVLRSPQAKDSVSDEAPDAGIPTHTLRDFPQTVNVTAEGGEREQGRVREQGASSEQEVVPQADELVTTRELIFINSPAFTIVDKHGTKRTVHADEYLTLLDDAHLRSANAARMREAGAREGADELESSARINSVLNPYRIIKQHKLLLGVKPSDRPLITLQELSKLKASDPEHYAKQVKDQGIIVHGYGLVAVSDAIDTIERVKNKTEDVTPDDQNFAAAVGKMQREQQHPLVRKFSETIEMEREAGITRHRAEFAEYAAKYGLEITDDGHIILEKAVFNIKGRLISIYDYVSSELGTDIRKLYNYRIGEWHEPRTEPQMRLVGDTYMQDTPDPWLYASPHEFAELFGKETRSPLNRHLSRSPLGAILGKKVILLQCAMPIDDSQIVKKGKVFVNGKIQTFSKVKSSSLFVLGTVT